MQIDHEKSQEICSLGIDEKRAGNYKKALLYYEKAKEYNVFNSSIYWNSSKILIGLGEYDTAMKNLLAYMYLNIMDEQYQNPMNMMQYELIIESYKWHSNCISDKITILPNDNIVNFICDQSPPMKIYNVPQKLDS